MIRKTPDIQLTQAVSQLLESGWKKHAWMLYRFTAPDKLFMVSVKIEAIGSDLKAVMQPHSVPLNQISQFVWNFGTQTHGLFSPSKLTIGNNLNDYRACSLSYIAETSRAADPGSLLSALDDLAHRMTASASPLAKLITKFEDAPVFRGPLMCMHLLAENYDSVRTLLNEDGVTAINGSGDVRYHIARYLDGNCLA